MRTVNYYTILIALLATTCAIAQTPEQQKMMEKAQRQYDSIMNSPEMQKQKREAEAFSKQFQAENAKKKAEEKTTNEKDANSSSDNNNQISQSSKMKFENWPHGAADIILQTLGRYSTATETKIGSINANGYFDFTMPDKVPTHSVIDDDRFLNCSSGANNTKWTKPQISYAKGNLVLKKENDKLGFIYMTSSSDIVEGSSLASDYHGIPGYDLGLYYLTGETSANSNCIIERRYGEGKDFDLEYDFELQLKSGWNIVKFEYTGERIFIDWGEGEHNKHSYFKQKKIYVVPELPQDVKWYFYSSR